MNTSVLSTSRFSASFTLPTSTPSFPNSFLFSVMNCFLSAMLSPSSFHLSDKDLTRVTCSATSLLLLLKDSFTFSWAFAADRAASFTPNRLFTHPPISFPYTTDRVIRAAIAVCHENSEESTCFHTGVAFFPASVSASYSLRADARASVNMGMLLEMARKNIWGPIASEGSSRAICCMLILTLLSFGAGLSFTRGVEPVFFFCSSSPCNSVFSCLTTPCSAWMSAIWASVFVPAAMACLNRSCRVASSCSSCAMTSLANWPILPRLPSTERNPFSVLSSSSISSLTGSIPILRVLFENIQW